MKFTYQWLLDFVEIKVSPEELSHKLTMAGLEVVSLEQKGKDWVFEVEVTSNRPDLLSVIGIAREVGLICKCKFKFKFSLPKTQKSSQKINIKIDSPQDCPFYCARVIKDVAIDYSPVWIKERLEAVGLRSINNVVDITNYVQFSLGHPLHAFDLDKIQDNLIYVRRAKEKENLLAIDGKSYILDKDILVIADGKRVIALAGIIGGKETEVGLSTKNILLESAKFNPLIIRRGRQKLGLNTESSYRFERDVDIFNARLASNYAVYLIKQFCSPKEISERQTHFFVPLKERIIFNVDEVERILGVKVKKEKISYILKGLEFQTKAINKSKLEVKVPSFRKDIKEGIDLVEEVARIWGYENIPLSLPYIKPVEKIDRNFDIISQIKTILIGQGLFEVINYSLWSKKILEDVGINLEDLLYISNPLSKLQEVLRPLLLPGLLFNISKNIRYQEGVSIFEMGRIFNKEKNEENFLGIALCGKRAFLTETGRKEEHFNLLHLKGVVELIFKKLGIRDFDFVFHHLPYLESNQSFIITIKQKNAGYLGKLNPSVTNKFDINKKDVFIAELNLDLLLESADFNKKYHPLPIYPLVKRDISILLKEEIPLKDLIKRIENCGLPLLKKIQVIDFYKGESIPTGFKAVTLGCSYYSDTHTLTDEEINTAHNKIIDLLKSEFSAQLR